MSELFGIYVHWPFCKSKCPYCDFNSHVSETIDHAQWRDAYEREIEYTASLTKGREVTSVFFGGGTPSLMEPHTVDVILNNVSKHWDISNDVEITLEANPTSIEVNKFQDFKEAGVNRVSIGVQSLKDDDLKFLGREHNADEAIAALKIADQIFDRFSFDLIYARPDQSVNAWKHELSEALKYAKGHLSLYQLTIEQGTPFYVQHARGDFSVPQGELAADLYEATQEIMGAENMPAYEVSNHAVQGQESLHNLTYWRYEDYAGIGPGAHGRLTLDDVKQATRTHRAPGVWLSKTAEYNHGYHPFETVNDEGRLAECLMMGLRLPEGASIAKLEEEAGKTIDELFDTGKLKALQQEGLLTFSNTHIQPTIAGMQRLNSVLRYLL
ncbi:MAG: coproporphyrinogen III oxidase [Alphaproteobacteria bacterium]|nr:coproporphyrinogen III oxidase [Alphaproteobacteria bacterium]